MKHARRSEAFGPENRAKMPLCRGRRPHLRDYDVEACSLRMRTLLLGASNTWFPVVYSTVAIPVESGRLAQLVDENWARLQNVTDQLILAYLRPSGELGELGQYSDQQIWEAIKKRHERNASEAAPPGERPDLKTPEWQVLIHFSPHLNGPDFRLPVARPLVFAIPSNR